MEEVDGLVLHALRQVGLTRLSSATHEGATPVATLGDLEVEDVVEAVSKCVMAIEPTLDLPTQMPPAMAARYRIGTSLADAVRAVGYRGQVGYQTFMYNNEADLRDLFVFLVEALPKEKMDITDHEDSASPAASQRIQKRCAEVIAQELKGFRTPSFLRPAWQKPGAVRDREDSSSFYPWGLSIYEEFETVPLRIPCGSATLDSSSDSFIYRNEILPWVWEQVPKQSVLLASLLETNSAAIANEDRTQEPHERKLQTSVQGAPEIEYNILDMLKSSVALAKSVATVDDVHTTAAIHVTPDLSPAAEVQPEMEMTAEPDGADVEEEEAETEDEEAKQESVIDKLRQDCDDAANTNEKLTQALTSVHAAKLTREEQIEQLQMTREDSANNAERNERVKVLLPNAASSIQKLESAVAKSQQKMIRLQEQWNAARMPLEQEIQTLAAVQDTRGSVVAGLKEETADMTSRTKKSKDDLNEKDASLQIITKQLDDVPKDAVLRTSFTKRILEIVANIKKQKVEVDRILADTKELQKDINFLNGKLERTFTETDELIFKDAKKDESIRRSYKLLASLHQSCGSLITVIEEIGATVRGIRDLEDLIEQEEELKMESNLKQISQDLGSMKTENIELMKQLS